jgi:tRNA threonylcarbamoyladenosine biosynthesis protein TsaE
MSRKNQDVITTSEEETIAWARQFSKSVRGGDIVLLSGDLGVGKSVFSRSMIRALCAAPALEVPSPTYTLVQTYEIQGGLIWHFDLYRLSDPSEIYETGWEDAISGGIVLVEWPERLGTLLPARRIDVKIEGILGNPNHRKISISHNGI